MKFFTRNAHCCGFFNGLTAPVVLRKGENRILSAVLHGLGDNTGIVIIAAWLFAGLFDKLMAAIL